MQNGYFKVEINQLRRADIIVTTGSWRSSQVIRNSIGSDISHAMLYVGNQEVIESIEQGVTQRSWTEAKGDVTLAIALLER